MTLKTQEEQLELLHALQQGQLDGFVVKDKIYLLNEARAELARLYDSKETMDALRDGSVDAFVIGGNVYTLKGADEPYRIFVEQMGEGALTINSAGLILYCNARFAQMTGAPMEEIIGAPTRQFIDPRELARFGKTCCDGRQASRQDEFTILHRNGDRISCLFSFSSNVLAGSDCIYVLATDLSHKKKNEELEKRVEERTAELSRVNESLQHEMLERLRAEKEMLDVSSEERARMGRDLHDGVSQLLTGMSYMAKALENSMTLPPGDVAKVREIAALAYQAMTELKGVSRNLNPKDSENQDFFSILEELARNVKRSFNIYCTVVGKDVFEVPSADERMHLYRIAQEAIHNAVKHGGAKTVLMSCERRDGRAALVIENDGAGIPDKGVAHEGMGIRNMKHRAHLIGAQLEIKNGPVKGTQVICTLSAQSSS